MRKWQNLAAPDDPDSWYDVDGVWPTNRGSYETADILSKTSGLAASGFGGAAWAWCSSTVTIGVAAPEYIIDGAKIWQYDGGSMNDRTGSVSIPAIPIYGATQFGTITILALGATRGAIAGTGIVAAAVGSNFATVSGAPEANIVCTQSNAVLAFATNTSQDGWAASDVGDHTNWSTGEAASGRIYQPGGNIVAAIPFGDEVIVFKYSSMHRMRYVGGLVKWAIDLISPNIGCGSANTPAPACAGRTGILFAGASVTDSGNPSVPWYWYDGANTPRLVNPMTEIPLGDVVYNPLKDIFTVWAWSTGSGTYNGAVYYYSPQMDAWGRCSSVAGGTHVTPVLGDFTGRRTPISNTGRAWFKSATSTADMYQTVPTTGYSVYFQSSMYGKPDRKTNWKRVTPILRRRSALSSPAVTATLTTYRERHDTSAQDTTTMTADTNAGTRVRYDASGSGTTDNFARFKVTYTDYDVEIDDFLVKSADAGED